MLYKRLIINGTEYRLAVDQTGSGAPSAATPGSVGVLYMDTDTENLYKCTGGEDGAWEWKPLSEGGSDYNLPVGGDQLGGVKNGGNVRINADGTMTAPDSGQNVDWNQNDPAAADFVKNRTHYEETEETVLFDGTVDTTDGWWELDSAVSLVDGQEYIVVYDGTEYKVTAQNDGLIYIGSTSLWHEEDYDETEPPFVIGNEWISTYPYGEHTIRVVGDVTKIHKIGSKFVGTDWNVNDPAQPGYIANRPFYEIPALLTQVKLIEDSWGDRATCKLDSTPVEWSADNSYKIRVDGVDYEFDGMASKSGGAALGNVTVYYFGAEWIAFNKGMDFSAYPFSFVTTDFTNIYAVFEDATLNHVIEFVESDGEICTIAPKYLPKAFAVTDVTSTPTADDFNALLNALREAGYLATK